MTLQADIEEYVAQALAAGRHLITQGGTVATSPSQISTDELTVILDGSTVAVPVKQIRSFPIFPGMRVALLLVGSEWTVVGPYSNPGAGSDMRIAVGADLPPELGLYGIGVAMLMWDTDKTSGIEVGYFFIGISNKLDGTANERVMLFGKVKYPVPGDPLSVTGSDVKTAFQINLNGETWFKDFVVRFIGSVPDVIFEEGVHAWFDDWITVGPLGSIDNDAQLLQAGTAFFDGEVQLSGTNNFVMSGSNLFVQDGAAAFMDGKPILAGENHLQLVSFSAVASHTIVVAFDQTYDVIPNVSIDIESGAGATARWHVRPISLSTTGFTIFLFQGDGTAGTWTNQGVRWTAVQSDY